MLYKNNVEMLTSSILCNVSLLKTYEHIAKDYTSKPYEHIAKYYTSKPSLRHGVDDEVMPESYLRK